MMPQHLRRNSGQLQALHLKLLQTHLLPAQKKQAVLQAPLMLPQVHHKLTNQDRIVLQDQTTTLNGGTPTGRMRPNGIIPPRNP